MPKGRPYFWEADFITELTGEAIAAHVEHGRKTPHVSSSMHLHPINGAAQRVGAGETAFGHRDKNFAPVILGIWPDPADNEANIKWVKDSGFPEEIATLSTPGTPWGCAARGAMTYR